MSEGESLEILHRFRAGGDIETVLRQVKDGDLLLQLSLVPESRRRYDFPYLSDMPHFIQVPDNSYLDCQTYEATFKDPLSPRTTHDHSGASEHQIPYLRPYHAAEMVDPLLLKVTAARWTSVISDEQLLMRLLNAYFLFHHPWFAAFNKDYFLEDMAAGRGRFCSPLLVNTVLAAACVSLGSGVTTFHLLAVIAWRLWYPQPC